ncbi:hypothetical protein DDY07_19555 [Methylomonas sp. ZR1]|nr:hypothetical protein [Methylomonas sp. ZR1]
MFWNRLFELLFDQTLAKNCEFCLFPLFGKDDCMDSGGRATSGTVAEGLGEIFQSGVASATAGF